VATPTQPGAQKWVPPDADINALRQAAQGCRGCELYENATQTVFSKGSPVARVVLVGEQPGDQEDRRGEPFVGPAGRLLDRAIAEAGIDPGDAYVTNAVKHFRFKQSAPGKRRIHQTPDLSHITACQPWLTAELALLEPEVLVTLGATASKALMGSSFRVTKQRGVLIPLEERDADEPTGHAGYLVATIHPSAVLRADDREAAYAGFLADLKVAAKVLG
jgi:uracil-DNA glycosylase family protein